MTTRRHDTTIPRPKRHDVGQHMTALVVLFSPDRNAIGHIARLKRDRLELGRGPGGPGLAFADPLASRVHATVSWDGARERWVVRDEESTNGTQLNGREVDSELIATGDVLRVGDTVLHVADFDLAAAGWCAPADSLLKGRSVALRQLLEEIDKVAPSDVVVLLVGETGTGKELAARQLHARSGRQGPFVAVNCAAIPQHLIESELFGHAKGAFSGAGAARKGLIAAADGGTLLLDEVGEMHAEVQSKLLRALEERAVRPIGENHVTPVDVRFLAATNRDLAQDTATGRFRADLLARLDQWRLELPPLRERREDLLAITEHFIEAHGGGQQPAVTGDLFEALALHGWPSNARELEAVVRRALILGAGEGQLELAHLRPELHPRPTAPASAAPAPPLPPADQVPTLLELERLLEHFGGNVSEVARYAGKKRGQVYRWIRRYGLSPNRYRR